MAKNETVYVVNLAQRKDKWADFHSHIQQDVQNKLPNLVFERFNAIVGWEHHTKDIPITPGELGCLLSHKKLWQKCLDDGMSYICVAEDDIRFPENYSWEKMASLLQDLPKQVEEWDIIYVSRQEDLRNAVELGKLRGLILDACYDNQTSNGIHGYIQPTAPRCGTHFYIASASGCRKMLEACAVPKAPVDLQLWFCKTPLRSFRVSRDMQVVEMCNASDTLKTNKVIDYLDKYINQSYTFVQASTLPEHINLDLIKNMFDQQPFPYESVKSVLKEYFLGLEDHPMHFHLCGLVAQLGGKIQEAVFYFRKVIDARPDNTLMYFDCSNTFKQAGCIEYAIESYVMAIKLQPECHIPYVNILHLLLQDTSNLKHVLKFAELALKKTGHVHVCNDIAMIYEKAGDLENALAYYLKSFNMCPTDYRINYNIGTIIMKSEKPEEGISYLISAIKQNAHFKQAYIVLHKYYLHKRCYDNAIDWIKKGMLWLPRDIDMSIFLAQALLEYGRFEECWDQIRKIQPRVDPRYCTKYGHDVGKEQQKRFLHLLGYYYEYTMQFDEAKNVFSYMYNNSQNLASTVTDLHNIQTNVGMLGLLVDPKTDFRLNYKLYSQMYKHDYHATSQYHHHYQLQLWNGQHTTGIYVINTSGLGDAIMFARFIPLLRSHGIQDIYFVVQQRLHWMFEGLCNLIASEEFFSCKYKPAMKNGISIGYFTDVVCLPYGLNMDYHEAVTQATPLYLKCDDGSLLPQDLNAEDRNIYFHLRSNFKNNLSMRRDIRANDFEKLFAIPKTKWYCTKHGISKDDERIIQKYKNVTIVDVNEEKNAFKDTITLLRNVHDIITVDTSLAHLAGSLGLNVHILLWNVPEWRWGLKSDRSEWYPSVRLYRQHSYGKWGNVIESLNAYLENTEFDVLIPISYGELLDRISILEIKREYCMKTEVAQCQRKNIEYDYERLISKRDGVGNGKNLDGVKSLYIKLFETNKRLWHLEDSIRDYIQNEMYNEKFIEAARDIAINNDLRWQVKKQINQAYAGKDGYEEKLFTTKKNEV